MESFTPDSSDEVSELLKMPLEASTVWPPPFQPGNSGKKPPTFRLGARSPGPREARQRCGGGGREAQVSAGATAVPAPDDPQTEPAPPSRAEGRRRETRHCSPPPAAAGPRPPRPRQSFRGWVPGPPTATRAAGGGDRGPCVRLLCLGHRDRGPWRLMVEPPQQLRRRAAEGLGGGGSHIHTPRSSLSQRLICKPQALLPRILPSLLGQVLRARPPANPSPPNRVSSLPPSPFVR